VETEVGLDREVVAALEEVVPDDLEDSLVL
jgi:hypothetical protein